MHGRGPKKCFHCGQEGHVAKQCPKKGNSPNPPRKKKTQTSKHPDPLVAAKDLLKNVDTEFIDTHIHLDYIMQKTKVIHYKKLRDRFFNIPNFGGCVCIFCDMAGLSPSLGIYNELLQEEKVYGAFGLHPHFANHYDENVEKRIIEGLKHKKAVALGECGLDYHYNNSKPELQRECFVKQCKLAVALKKPIVIHSREAEQDTLDIMKKHLPQDWKIHVHCFTDTPEFAQKLLAHFKNIYFGFTGVITYPSAKQIQQTVKICPLEKILLETDGP